MRIIQHGHIELLDDITETELVFCGALFHGRRYKLISDGRAFGFVATVGISETVEITGNTLNGWKDARCVACKRALQTASGPTTLYIFDNPTQLGLWIRGELEIQTPTPKRKPDL